MDARNCITLQPDAVEYPAVLRRCELNARPPVITVQGNFDLKIIDFFCSVRCPGDAILKIYDLARALRNHNITHFSQRWRKSSSTWCYGVPPGS